MADKVTWIIIPAFNEAGMIAETIGGVRRYFPNIVVVDDCSTDGTADLALAAGATVCRHPVNLGQGAALQTGFEFALGVGADVVVTFDADGQHRPEDAVAMANKLEREQLDVVLASRFLGQALGISWQKRLLLRSATLYTRLGTGLDLTDTHNGLRAMSRKAFGSIRLRHNRMAHASEFLSQTASLKLTYAEHPVTIVYTEYSKAKGQKLSGMFAILSDLVMGRLYK